jgi:hypothetical protein
MARAGLRINQFPFGNRRQARLERWAGAGDGSSPLLPAYLRGEPATVWIAAGPPRAFTALG